MTQDFEAVHAGHLDVQQDELEGLLGENRNRFVAVAGGPDIVPFAGELAAQHGTQRFFVVNHEDGTRFIACEEANAPAEYKQMIIESSASDIVYTSLFTGVHGNYLKGSIVNAGMDPDNLPEGDKSKMDFGSGSAKAKAWKDIWGSGQGVGQMSDAPPAGVIVERLEREYAAARAALR